MSDPSGWKRRQTTPADAARRAEYDSPEYRRERARLGREVKAGRASCWRCGGWIAPGSKWNVGHDDHDRSIIRGAEDESCNLKSAASKGARTANANRKARKAGLLPSAPSTPARRAPTTTPAPRPVCTAHGRDCPGLHSRDW